eukprot:CAMPEP_0115738174 /NCGR_PEP_ID=MMETSP0272-20121206/88241_1 /TAXON_ID=71861 /ORGANISM="Scrippsiella trochoidea, Strain CCMP3099" /LENGTH=49 /DNA_ID= /DNA_START= /DNA_END= /DNA_ORIENTATION=
MDKAATTTLAPTMVQAQGSLGVFMDRHTAVGAATVAVVVADSAALGHNG